MWTRLQDGFQSRLMDAYGATVIHQAWNPVVVYLNGVYWGHYNMRERVDRFFVAQHEGISLDEADSMVILEASGAAKYGTQQGVQGHDQEDQGRRSREEPGGPAVHPGQRGRGQPL